MTDKRYVISLEVDDQGAIANIDTVDKELQQATGSANNLKKELRDLQKQLANTAQGSDEFARLSKEAGTLKDKLGDAAQAARANAGSAFEVLSNNSRNLKDSLINLDFEGVSSSLRGIGGAAGSIKFKDLQDGIKNVGASFASFGKTLLANPIFLLVGVLAAVILNFDKIKEVLDVGVNPATRELVKTTNEAREAADNAAKAYDLEERRLRALGVTEEEISAGRRKRTEQQLATAKAQAEAEAKILSEKIAANAGAEALAGTGAAGAALSLFGPSDSDVEASKERLKKLKEEIEVFNVQILEIDKKERDRKNAESDAASDIIDAGIAKREAEAKRIGEINKAASAKRAEERQKEAEELAKNAQEISDLVAQLEAETLKEAAEYDAQRAAQVKAANDARILAADQQFQLEQELFQTREEAEIAAVVAKYEKLNELANGNAELESQVAEAQAQELANINQQRVDAEVAADKQLQESKLQMSVQGLTALADLVTSFGAKSQAQAKRQFEINKAASIATAVVNTYLGATAAYAQTVGGPIIKAAAASIAVISGLAQVNKIRQTKFQAAGGGGGAVSAGGGGGGGSVATGGGEGQAQGAPAFNPVNTDFANNRPAQATPAYVLAGNVIDQTQARTQIDQQARLQ